MEKMVTDKTIKKVIIVSDRGYTEKSDSRKGGAGTEAQIISKELYQEDQDKFVAVVRERDERGEPYLPAYYTSRIFIDFSDDGLFSGSFEQLMRWIEDKPLHERPPIGELPPYVTEGESTITISTGPSRRRAYDAITGSKGHAYSATKDYFDLFVRELERFRFDPEVDPLAEEFLENFQAFLPYRDECLEVVRAISRNTHEDRFVDIVHSFFDGFLQYTEPPASLKQYKVLAMDNYKFFAYELFLHCCTMFFSEHRPDLFGALVERQYYLERKRDFGREPLVGFTAFHQYLESLNHRNQALKLERTSLAADMIKERAVGSGAQFRKLMEMDFVLFLRADLAGEGGYNRWWPDTSVYLGWDYRAFEMFERSRSSQYFVKYVYPFLGANKEELEQLLEKYTAPNGLDVPQWHYRFRLVPKTLIGIEGLCTKP